MATTKDDLERSGAGRSATSYGQLEPTGRHEWIERLKRSVRLGVIRLWLS
jgi:hypothetical protein